MTETLRQRILDTAHALAVYDRIAVAGGPISGKSLFASVLPTHTWIETDSFILLPWADQPQAIIEACEKHERYVLTGVQTGRALRAGLTPDVAVWLGKALKVLSPQQTVMAKGCWTIFDEWRSGTKTECVII